MKVRCGGQAFTALQAVLIVGVREYLLDLVKNLYGTYDVRPLT